MNNQSKVKVLAVASGGGHLVQLLRLSSSLDKSDVYYMTTMDGFLNRYDKNRVFLVKDASKTNILGLVVLLLQIILAMIKVRPDAVITTGAAPGYFAIRVGKIFGAKTLWIDSIANSEELSLSGKMALKSADLCLTQWPDLTKKYDGLEYKGGVL